MSPSPLRTPWSTSRCPSLAAALKVASLIRAAVPATETKVPPIPTFRAPTPPGKKVTGAGNGKALPAAAKLAARAVAFDEILKLAGTPGVSDDLVIAYMRKTAALDKAAWFGPALGAVSRMPAMFSRALGGLGTAWKSAVPTMRSGINATRVAYNTPGTMLNNAAWLGREALGGAKDVALYPLRGAWNRIASPAGWQAAKNIGYYGTMPLWKPFQWAGQGIQAGYQGLNGLRRASRLNYLKGIRAERDAARVAGGAAEGVSHGGPLSTEVLTDTPKPGAWDRFADWYGQQWRTRPAATALGTYGGIRGFDYLTGTGGSPQVVVNQGGY